MHFWDCSIFFPLIVLPCRPVSAASWQTLSTGLENRAPNEQITSREEICSICLREFAQPSSRAAEHTFFGNDLRKEVARSRDTIKRSLIIHNSTGNSPVFSCDASDYNFELAWWEVVLTEGKSSYRREIIRWERNGRSFIWGSDAKIWFLKTLLRNVAGACVMLLCAKCMAWIFQNTRRETPLKNNCEKWSFYPSIWLFIVSKLCFCVKSIFS